MHESDGELASFRGEMDRLERLTRVTCTIVGGLFGILTIYCLLTGWPIGALAFLFPTAICLARGLCKAGSDLEAVRGFRILGFLRWTFPLGWWSRKRW
jgi:hypothetical protein